MIAQNRDTFRYLIKVAGSILFIIGLVLNILMIFLGFWPSLLYVLIMLAGAGMFSLNKNARVKLPSMPSFSDGLNKLLPVHRLKLIYSTIEVVLKTALITGVALILTGLLFFWMAQDYFKKEIRLATAGILWPH